MTSEKKVCVWEALFRDWPITLTDVDNDYSFREVHQFDRVTQGVGWGIPFRGLSGEASPDRVILFPRALLVGRCIKKQILKNKHYSTTFAQALDLTAKSLASVC